MRNWEQTTKTEVRGEHWIIRRTRALQLQLILGHGIPQYFAGSTAIYEVLEMTAHEKTYWD